jgi:uncharacterized repeat protein (TIGR03803 family)
MKHTYRVLSIFAIFLSIHSYSQEFWGMTSSGGAYGLGTLFKADTGCTNTQVKYSFVSNIPGSTPDGDLVQASNGKFYGMTSSGGSNSTGILFEYDPTSGVYTKKFEFNGANGANPNGSLVQGANGKLYGMTPLGGANNMGVLFSYDPVTSLYNRLINFSGSANGANPMGSLIQASTGKLYGMTSAGGANGLGILFSYDPATGIFIDKIDFAGVANGSVPNGSLVQAFNGKLYGLTSTGGIKNDGVLFSYDTTAGTLTKMIDFDSIPKGCNPNGALVEISHGKLFGTTLNGGALGNGIVFSYVISTGIFTDVTDLNASTQGGNPSGSLVLAPNGKFYGLTSAGGANGFGTLFQLDTTSLTLVDKVDLAGISNGQYPKGSLIYALDGKLYGMASSGGLNNSGVLFQFDPGSGTYTDKVDLETATNGAVPTGSVIMASNGKLYGMTTSGGTGGTGVLFEYDTALATCTAKVQFTGMNGVSPNGSLIQASNGKIYGLTTAGGISSLGVLFEYDPSTNICVKKFDFDGAANGAAPFGSLVQANNGLLYGMCSAGGANSAGVIFSYDPTSGTLTKTIDFDPALNGSTPYGSLIQTNTGTLYGLTSAGGLNGTGILFSYSIASATCNKMIDFTGTTNGTNPYGSLIESPSGKLYGATSGGGSNGQGVIFEYDTVSATLTNIFSMNPMPDGDFPQGSLTIAGNKFYLTADYGGINNVGALMQYDPTPNTAIDKTDFSRTTTGADPYGDLLYLCNPVTITSQSVDTAKCPGSSCILWVNTTGKYVTYQWYKNGTLIVGANNANYVIPSAGPSDSATYYCAVSNPCGNLNTVNTKISLYPQPAIPTISSGGSTLTSSAATGNQWYLNGTIIGGATAQSYTTTQNGNYTVTATNANGCSATSAPFNMTNTGIMEKSGGLTVDMYPNPASSVLNLTFQTDRELQIDMTIIDLLGNTILSEKVYLTKSANNTTLDVSSLSAGVYVLKLNSVSGTTLIKFFKQ